MTDTTGLECEICFEKYDEHKHKPRVLECGHSFCSYCIAYIFKTNKSCPDCRSKITYTSVENVPISYALLKLCINQVPTNDYQGDSIDPLMVAKLCKQHKIVLDFWCRRCREWICSTCALDKHKQYPKGSCDLVSRASYLDITKDKYISMQIQNLHETASFVNSLKNITKELNLAERILSTKKNNLLQQLTESERQLQEIKKQQLNAALAVDKFKKHENKTNCLLNKIKETTSLEKADQFSKTSVQQHEEVLEWFKKSNINQSSHGVLSDIFAQREEDGQVRWAQVTVDKGKLKIHSLQEKRPPMDSKIIQYNELCSHTSLPLVFLDIGWKKESHGEVIIKLRECNDLAVNFLLLVTGRNGPSYKGSVFHGKRSQPSPLFIKGGDYNHGNGSGGQPVLPMIDQTKLVNETPRPGTVHGVFPAKPNTLSQFTLVYNYPKQTEITWPIIGEVIKGINIVEDAIKCEDVVYIHDCGAIFKL